MEVEYINEIINFASNAGEINKGEIEFYFNETLEPNTVKVFQILDSLSLGNKTFNRVGAEIYYESIKYTTEVTHLLSNEEGERNEDQLFAFAETKVALIWFRNPFLINYVNDLFSTINVDGISISSTPKSPVNPNFRKSFVTIRNRYIADNVCNNLYKRSTAPTVSIQSPHKRVNSFFDYQPFINKSDQDINTEKERKMILSDSKNNETEQQYDIDTQPETKKSSNHKKKRLSYYSNTNNNTGLCTSYKIDDEDQEEVEIVTGVLCFVVITGSNTQIKTNVMIEGRLCYSDSSK